jgi:hypothetical protein
MKQKRKLETPECFKVRIVVNKQMNAANRKVLNPEKLEMANYLLANMKSFDFLRN